MEKKEARKAYSEIGKAIALLNEMKRNASTKSEQRKLDAILVKAISYEDELCELLRNKNHLSFTQFEHLMSRANDRNENIEGVIVYRQSNWSKHYSLLSRSYVVSSREKVFQRGAGGYSMFGSNLDGTDQCVRLERIGWTIEYCFIIGK